MIGETVGSYRIVGALGEGGMGVVYRAAHPFLGRQAVVKMLVPELSRRTDMVERFFNEARATSLIKHPGIVDVFDFGYHTSGRAFLVMELLEGESLTQRMRRVGRLSARAACGVARQIASALGAAHARGIVHRDLKPDNLFLVPDPAMPEGERVKVLDFGIAKLGEAPGAMQTMAGVVLGTPAYMAPEQCQSAGQVDGRADIYALACLVFEMMTGRPPFLGEGMGAIMAGHLFEAAPALRSFAPDAPAVLEALLGRMLAKSPAHRPATMDAVVAAFEDIEAGLGRGTEPGRVRLALTGVPAAPPEVFTTLGRSAIEIVRPPSQPARRWRIAASAFAALVVAAIAGRALVGGGDRDATRAAAAGPVSASVPASVPAPGPVPAPVPVADPVPVPAADPVPVPVPEPVAEPVPEPVPVPVPEPEPVPVPVAEPVPVAVPVPVPGAAASIHEHDIVLPDDAAAAATTAPARAATIRSTTSTRSSAARSTATPRATTTPPAPTAAPAAAPVEVLDPFAPH